jgi:hypothetical protein
MSFRISTQKIILIELTVSILFLVVGILTLSEAEIIWLIPTTLFIHLLIFSAPLALVHGFDFIIYDAAPTFSWKYYGFIAIFIATFLGGLLDNTLLEFVLSSRN